MRPDHRLQGPGLGPGNEWAGVLVQPQWREPSPDRQRASAGVQLANNLGPAAETDYAPAWSPDGKRIVFVASIEGVDLYSVNRDGTGFSSFLEQGGVDVGPSWYR